MPLALPLLLQQPTLRYFHWKCEMGLLLALVWGWDGDGLKREDLKLGSRIKILTAHFYFLFLE